MGGQGAILDPPWPLHEGVLLGEGNVLLDPLLLSPGYAGSLGDIPLGAGGACRTSLAQTRNLARLGPGFGLSLGVGLRLPNFGQPGLAGIIDHPS